MQYRPPKKTPKSPPNQEPKQTPMTASPTEQERQRWYDLVNERSAQTERKVYGPVLQRDPHPYTCGMNLGWRKATVNLLLAAAAWFTAFSWFYTLIHLVGGGAR
jgi:hypothetical protein